MGYPMGMDEHLMPTGLQILLVLTIELYGYLILTDTHMDSLLYLAVMELWPDL